MEFSGIFYNYIVNKEKVRVKKLAEIYNYIVNKEKMYVKKTSENLQLYMKYNNIPEIKKTGTSKDLPASRQKLLRFAAR